MKVIAEKQSKEQIPIKSHCHTASIYSPSHTRASPRQFTVQEAAEAEAAEAEISPKIVTDFEAAIPPARQNPKMAWKLNKNLQNFF